EKTSGRGGRKKNVLEALISIGAFDRFGKRTAILQDFYDRRGIKDRWAPDFTNEQTVIDTEVRLVGNYITIDPMDEYREAIEKIAVDSPKALEQATKGDKLNVGGEISK